MTRPWEIGREGVVACLRTVMVLLALPGCGPVCLGEAQCWEQARLGRGVDRGLCLAGATIRPAELLLLLGNWHDAAVRKLPSRVKAADVCKPAQRRWSGRLIHSEVLQEPSLFERSVALRGVVVRRGVLSLNKER